MLFTIFVFGQKYPFLGKFDPKNKGYQLKLKIGTLPNLNMENSVAFSAFRGNTLLGQNWSKKSKLSV